MNEVKTILIVEDDPTAIHLLTNILQKTGYQVEVATDGYAGLSKLRECKPQLILCDIVMPRLDGFAFCREVRKVDTNVAIIIISSSVEVKDLLSVLNAQASIPKPINNEMLLDTIKELIGPGQLKEEKIGREPQPLNGEQKNIGQSRRILVLDDEKSISELLKSILERCGFVVILAATGYQGLKAVAVQKVDLIIVDVLMPEMDGYTFCKELKREEVFSHIPIIIISGRRKMEESFMDVGVSSFLTKPFTPDDILSKVSALLPPGVMTASVDVQSQTAVSVQKAMAVPAMAKKEDISLKKVEKSLPSLAKKILICGEDDTVLEDMRQRLQGQGCAVTVEKIGRQIAPKTDVLYPDIILLQLYFNEEAPVDQIIADINKVILRKVRDHEDKFKDKTKMPELRTAAIILYKVPEEVTASATTGENLALMEDLLARCREQGIAKYIGMYSPMSFLTKIKEFIA